MVTGSFAMRPAIRWDMLPASRPHSSFSNRLIYMDSSEIALWDWFQQEKFWTDDALVMRDLFQVNLVSEHIYTRWLVRNRGS